MSEGLSLPQVISYILTGVVCLRILGYLGALFTNRYIPLVAVSIIAAFGVAKACFRGVPQATHVLLIAFGIVFMTGCSDTIQHIRDYRAAYLLAAEKNSFHLLWNQHGQARVPQQRQPVAAPQPQALGRALPRKRR